MGHAHGLGDDDAVLREGQPGGRVGGAGASVRGAGVAAGRGTLVLERSDTPTEGMAAAPKIL